MPTEDSDTNSVQRDRPGQFGKTVDLSGYRGELATAKVLVLEDDADMREILADYLESVHYEVVAVANGLDGLHKVLALDFDAIVCDMMMPGLAGDLFYLAVERTKPEHCARFVFITGHSANEKIKYFIEQIGGTMLSKPFHMEDLYASIKYVLRATELRRALKKRERH